MRMTNGARGKTAFAIGSPAIAQCYVPFLDVERAKLLQRLGANVRCNLIIS